ncbi:aspartate dehydrogenase domain-containing protein [Pararhodobacter sp. CCB-MM2]|uniref:aspartate dehydrogenase domain-containing protein n=1 Tax=Pararhodobacter sp. CCB-MM2 TaxID=1786003 RepID=UPI00082A81FE|nr:aspartate dehydrogenase domain-containing protein [Pararhodobacter sp. CCB-MM2]
MNTMKRVGLIGAGTIGRTILKELQSLPGVEIAFVLVRDPSAHADLGLPEGCVIADEAVALERGADLVVEAAMADTVQRLAPDFLRHGDFCGFSSTALADRATEDAVREAALTHGRRFYVPHGAVLGLDGLGDGQGLIDSVTITTTKSGKSLGIDPDTEGAIFDGPTRDACHRFPRNVNVHAAIALAGLGFDRTISRIVAVPGLVDMKHRIEVTGQGLAWDLGITSRSLGGVTGAYTPRSAAGTVRRILGGAGVVVA